MLPVVNAEFIGKSMHDHKIGIIDIGSNSVRLVVFDGVRRTPLPIYNEKAFCALGKGLSDSGKLNPAGVEMAKASIDRFLLLARLMEVVELQVLATAAVRDAEDGEKFVQALEKKHNVHIQIISGKREARLGAMGVLSSFHKPEGLVGDLGGGSMELVLLEKNCIAEQTTLPIGPLRMLEEGKSDPEKTRRTVKKYFSEYPWITDAAIPNFYAIGGSFRAIAKINMARHGYPLKILHHYTVEAEELKELLQMLSAMSAEDVARLAGASSKRAPALVPAAAILLQLMEEARTKRVIFSAHGIREGYMYEKLSPYIQADDGLLSSAADLANQAGRIAGYAREMSEWMAPLFTKESESQERLRIAACMLSEIAWRIHPEYRASWIYDRVLHSSLVGISHAERVFLATCLYHRHQFKLKPLDAGHLIDESQRHVARVIGTATNLACHLSGGITGNLSKTKLQLEKGEIRLFLAQDIQELMGDTVKKRLDGLAEAFRAASSMGK